MATKKPAAAGGFRFNYGEIIQEAEKEFQLTEASPTKERMQCGLNVVDVILGGGYAPGRMFGFSGGESCGKSTSMMKALYAAGKQDVGFINYWDYEGSFDRTYMNQMVADDKIAEIISDRMRVWPKNHGEDFFNAQGEILRRMPDKKFLDDRWWLGFPGDEKTWIQFFSEENCKAHPDRKYNKELKAKYGMYFVESDPSPQGIIFVDSWAAMLPKDFDEVDSSNTLSPEAQMFSKHLKKVAGKLEEKRIILVGANQLREKPMAKGDPYYEPGGRALEFYSSARIRQHFRVNGPDDYQNLTDHDKGMHHEKSVLGDEGAHDRYRYIFFENKKNKTALPYLTGWGRIWVRDHENKARGWDPVFDAWWYLLMTGQIVGVPDNKGGIKTPKMKQFGLRFEDLVFDKMDWYDFKRLILLKGDPLREHCEKLGITQPPRILDRIAAQVKEGKYELNTEVV